MNLQSDQPTTAPLGRSQSERGRGAESRDSRLDKERLEHEQLKAVDTRSESVLKRASATETAKGLGEGLKTKSFIKSPNPNPNPLHLEVFSILKGGVDSLSENDFGRPWPDPKRSRLRSLTAGKPRDLCLKAAWEAREIVQAQDRAPNITALFGRKLDALHEVRGFIRRELS